jgi:hypothetical protein
MMRFHCPHCPHILEVSQPTEAYLCPACKRWCRIPILAELELDTEEVGEVIAVNVPPLPEPRLACMEQEEEILDVPQGTPAVRRDAITERRPEERPLRFRDEEEVEDIEFAIVDEEEVEDIEFVIVEDGDERQRRSGPRRSPGSEAAPRQGGMKIRRRMALAKLGLGFYYAKFLCTIVAIVLSIASSVFAILPGGGAVLGSAAACASMPMLALTPLLGLVGGVLCFWVPKKAQARLLIQISFGLDAGSIFAASSGIVSGLVGVVGVALGLTIVGLLAGIAAGILFLFFLRALAYYLADSVSGNEAIHLMIHWLLAMMVPPFLLLIAVSAAVKAECIPVAQLFIFVGLPIWIFLYARVLLNLLQLISTIRQRIASCFDLD